MQGSAEKYFLNEKDGVTVLDIESDMDEEMYDMMNSAWDKAIIKLKQLAEAA